MAKLSSFPEFQMPWSSNSDVANVSSQATSDNVLSKYLMIECWKKVCKWGELSGYVYLHFPCGYNFVVWAS